MLDVAAEAQCLSADTVHKTTRKRRLRPIELGKMLDCQCKGLLLRPDKRKSWLKIPIEISVSARMTTSRSTVQIPEAAPASVLLPFSFQGSAISAMCNVSIPR
jgi:hypothetical protein